MHLILENPYYTGIFDELDLFKDWLEREIGPAETVIRDLGDYRELETNPLYNKLLTLYLALADGQVAKAIVEMSIRFNGLHYVKHPEYTLFQVRTTHIDGRGPDRFLLYTTNASLMVKLKLLEIDDLEDLHLYLHANHS